MASERKAGQVPHPEPEATSAAMPVILGPDLRRRPRGTGAILTRTLSTLAINHGVTFLVASLDGGIGSDGGAEQGLYSDDTRFLSHHELLLNGRPLHTIASTRLNFRHARWTLIAHEVGSVAGDVPDASATVVLDRVISDRRLHEDLRVRAYAQRPVSLLLSIDLGCDFADVFEVRTRRWQRRSTVTTLWQTPGQLDTRYTHQDFVRRCLVRATRCPSDLAYANGALRFPIDLEPGQEWRVCLQYDLLSSLTSKPRLPACPLMSPVVPRRVGAGGRRAVVRHRVRARLDHRLAAGAAGASPVRHRHAAEAGAVAVRRRRSRA